MSNPRRGEIEAEFGDRRFVLCLTLGALAELEHRFGEPDLVGVARRFEEGRLSARDLLAIIGCGLRGGGTAMSDEEVAVLRVAGGLQGYVEIAASLLNATFAAETVVPAFPPAPQSA